MKRLLVIAAMLYLISAGIANAAFISGSTGADGAFYPSTNTVLQVPTNGIFNYSTINIPAGVTVTFTRNAANTPIYMLATGDVTISGTINASGGSTSQLTAGVGGPGGFAGGNGGGQGRSGSHGLGPGGGGGGTYPDSNYSILGGGAGYATAGSNCGVTGSSCGAGGAAYGNARIIPLIGGSGGGGRANIDRGGGGGGGAILIASSGKITFSGSITANGGRNTIDDWAGPGSGGAIKLMANEITGGGSLSAKGGTTRGSAGRIRVEATTNNISNSSDPPYTYGRPPDSLSVANLPSLQITKIADTAVPVNPTGSYAQPDLLLPSTTANPVSVAVSASNIPVGTTVTVTATPISGSASSASAVLAGTTTSSTATANVTLSTEYTSVIMATTTVTIQAMYYNGERIETAIVKALPGQESEVTYVSESGKKFKEQELILAGLILK